MQANYLYDVIGVIGVLLIVGTYFLLMIHRVSARELTYPLLNAVGAAFIIFSLLHNFNFAAFLIELFWLIISIIGIASAVRTRMNTHNKKL